MKSCRPAILGVGIATGLTWVLVNYNQMLLRSPPPDRVARIVRAGELRVAVPADWSPTRMGAPALEWTLVTEFANRLGVGVRVQPVAYPRRVEDALTRGEADLGMTGAAIPGPSDPALRLGPVYRKVQPVVLCPDRAAPVRGRALRRIRLYAPAGAQSELLRGALERQMPALRWHETPDDGPGLLALAKRNHGCALLAESQLTALRVTHPGLPDAVSLRSPLPGAWLLASGADTSLDKMVEEFFEAQRASGELERLREHHEGPAGTFGAADYRTLHAAMNRVLPRYLPAFRAAAARHGLAWELLAALAYQESRWQANAVSPTGTHGLMMLTRVTTQELGQQHPLLGTAGIEPGARYLAYLRRTVAPHAPEPDRSWFAVAAYNVGPAPILRARRLAARNGHSSQRWADVKPYLRQALAGRPATAHRHLIRHVDAVRRYQAALSQAQTQSQTPFVPASPPATGIMATLY